MKAALAAISVFTAAAGCWLSVMELLLQHPGFQQRMIIAALITAQSILTLLVAADSAGRAGRVAVSAGACGILALGVVAVLKNLTGPHFEGFAIVIGAALVVQAALTLLTTMRGASTRVATLPTA